MRPRLLTILLLAAVSAGAAPQAAIPPGQPRVSSVEAAPGVKLEVLEWSDEGPPLVLLAGATRSAWSYINFAPHFTDRFRVIGITRRRVGRSDAPQEPFGIAELANDVIAVLDAFSIDRAFFIGHSFGGAELSQIALEHPERARKMVYLDGAWDFRSVYYSEGWWDPWPEQPPTESDRQSPQAVAAYFARTQGYLLPIEEIESIHAFDADGKLVGLHPNVGSMFRDMIGPTLEPLDYSRITTPVLVVRAIPRTVEDLFPAYATYDADDQRLARVVLARWVGAVVAESQRFVDGVPGARELLIEGGSHEVVALHSAEFLPAVRAYLLQEGPD